MCFFTSHESFEWISEDLPKSDSKKDENNHSRDANYRYFVSSIECFPGFESEFLKLEYNVRITRLCSHKDIQSSPVEELFMPKKDVKNPSGVFSSIR